MTNAKYLIRVDDICEGFNLTNFNRIKYIFEAFNIRPIIAVVPNNKDEKLIYQNSIYGENFWTLINSLEKKFKWKVGIHGFEHNYTNNNSGILKINNFSEFSGLAYFDQKKKIENALNIFNRYNLSTDLFIAPAHSFDKNTLKVLIDLGINKISDGFYTYPGKDESGLFWIPQQLWDFKLKKKGIWTINLHINSWKDVDFDNFVKNIKLFKDLIVDFEYVEQNYSNKKLNLLDLFRNYYEIRKNNLIRYLVKIKKLINLF